MAVKIKKIILGFIITILATVSFSGFTLAATEPCPPDRPACTTTPTTTAPTTTAPIGNTCATDAANPTNCLKKIPIVTRLNDVVNVLAGLVGVVVVGVIILGGIQYSMAGDKAEAVSAAKKRIINGLMALAAFLFIYTFLQWLIPGGIFK